TYGSKPRRREPSSPHFPYTTLFRSRRRRCPHILGAHQHEQRDAGGPVGGLPLDITGGGVERDRNPKIALRQVGGPARALRADREQRDPAALRPAEKPDAVAAHKGLRLQVPQRAIRISRPRAIDVEFEAEDRAHLAVIARPKAVDEQKDIALPGQFGGPFAIDRRNRPGGSTEHAAAPVQADDRRAPLLARWAIEISVELRRTVERREMHNFLRHRRRQPEQKGQRRRDNLLHRPASKMAKGRSYSIGRQ